MSDQETRIYTHTLRTRVTEAELNMVSNMAAREDVTAAQLVRRWIRQNAEKVPMGERKDLAEQPTVGMRALKMGVHDAFAKPEKKPRRGKTRRVKKSKKGRK